MRKVTWTFFSIVTSSLLVLGGCSENSTREKELEKEVTELKKQIEEQKAEEKVVKEEEKKEDITVKVIDPSNQKEIKVIDPKKLGYETDREKYRKIIENWAKRLARGSEGKEGYDQKMTPDKIGKNGVIIKGKPRRILEESELIEKVMTASEKGGTVELPLYVTESGYNPTEVHQLGEVVVASYTTYYNSGVAGRSKNIELSARAINNAILGVDDMFSFNTAVGPSDAAHGYQPAEEAVNGKLVMGIGGGICQTSSTLYNAIDKLGVKYIEKHHHSVNVGYVPKGRDATVSYGGVDFRFQNTVGVPLLLKAYTKNGTLTVEVRTSKKYKGLI